MVWAVSLLTTDLSTRRLTARLPMWVFGVCFGLVSLSPLADSVLYPPHVTTDAVPRYISERTSYLCVRLAFHLYSQLIPCFCTNSRFGPPPAVRQASPWS